MTQPETIPNVLTNDENDIRLNIESVHHAGEHDGWVVKADKCRDSWRNRVEGAGLRVGTIYGRSDGVRIHVRPE